MADTVSSVLTTEEVHYPESDGEPMGETGIHALVTLQLMGMLRAYFRQREDVYIGANMFMYYTEGRPADVVAPDIFVAFGTHKQERRTWKIWEEGKAPDLIIEITSEATKGKDRWFKRGLYEELGVTEYFQFDPFREHLDPPLQGYRLGERVYQPLESTILADGQYQLESQVLQLHLRNEDNQLRLYEVESGQKLLTHEEAEDELARLKAAYDALKNQLNTGD